jgi:hypothetical protein
MHRGIREQHLARRADDRHGILKVLNGGLEIRNLTGHLRAIGRELRADRVEKFAQLAELILLVEIQTDAEFTPSEAREAAPDDMNRPEENLREEHSAEDRHAERN